MSRTISASDLDALPYITCETTGGGAILVTLPTDGPVRFYDMDADPWTLMTEVSRSEIMRDTDAGLWLNLGRRVAIDRETLGVIAGWVRDQSPALPWAPPAVLDTVYDGLDRTDMADFVETDDPAERTGEK